MWVIEALNIVTRSLTMTHISRITVRPGPVANRTLLSVGSGTFPDGITARARTLKSDDWSPQSADKDSPHAGEEDAGKSDSCGAGTWLGDLEDEYADAHVDQQAELGDREADAGAHPHD
jgi:hypothetical protein